MEFSIMLIKGTSNRVKYARTRGARTPIGMRGNCLLVHSSTDIPQGEVHLNSAHADWGPRSSSAQD